MSKTKTIEITQKLLDRVAVWYSEGLGSNSKAKEALEEVGLGDNQVWPCLQLGYSNGTLQKMAPRGSEIYTELQGLGVLDAKGKEVFAGCITVPRFNPQGECIGMCGWKAWQEKLVFLPGTEKLMEDISTVPELVERLQREANPQTVTPESQPLGYEKTQGGFVMELSNRLYEAKGVSKEHLKLRITLMTRKRIDGQHSEHFYLDAVDLYSHRSRQVYARGCAEQLGEAEEIIFEDLNKLISLAEGWKPESVVKAMVSMTKAEEEEALGFLKDPHLLDRILEDFEICGYTGEETNKVIGYLAAVSRKLDDPLAVLVQSRSAAGKSTLQDAVLKFVPREDFERYTRLTGQALFYKDEMALCHKLLAIEEEAGSKEASYSLRNLQSAKSLTIATTGRDSVTGKMRTTEYQVMGPTALMLTTTSVNMDFETQNRFITLTIDESKEMTEKILTRQREADTLEGLRGSEEREKVIRRQQNAQRLLKPLKIINPFADQLSFPSDSLRARRDHKKYLNLIKIIAFLHQYQREVKTYREGKSEPISYIEVVKADIERANQLAKVVLNRTVDEISAPSRLLLGEVKKMVQSYCKDKGISPKECRFTRKEIRDWCKWSDFQVQYHLKQLVELEYLHSVTGKWGKQYVYELSTVVESQETFLPEIKKAV